MEWEAMPHADRWLVFGDNIGPRMSIDETSTKDGELFTILSNKDGHGRRGSIAAIVSGTRAEDVAAALERIPEDTRRKVREVTMDFSYGMSDICGRSFPRACQVIDRFHMQKLVLDALQGIRMSHLKEERRTDAAARKEWTRSERSRILRSKNFYLRTGRPLPSPKPFRCISAIVCCAISSIFIGNYSYYVTKIIQVPIQGRPDKGLRHHYLPV